MRNLGPSPLAGRQGQHPMTTWTDETAEWYAEKYGEYPTNHLAVDMLELAPDAVVLDIGCGTAAALRHAASKVTSGRLLGVDPVPRMVEIARERVASHPAAGRIELHVAPADALPFDDGTIDVVLAFDSYDHWAPRQREGLAEVRRVLARFVVVKDASVPFAGSAAKAFVDALGEAGFTVSDARTVDAGEVSFAMWTAHGRDAGM